MATLRKEIYLSYMGGTGNVFPAPASLNLGANDRYPHEVIEFKDSATRDMAAGRFSVPKNYVGTAVLVIVWASVATSGNAIFDFDYRAIGGAESLDPTTDQESVTSGAVAVNGTARTRKETTISLTSGNFAVDDEVLFNFGRDGAAADTIAASLFVIGLYFQYADA